MKEHVIHVKLTPEERNAYAQKCALERKKNGDKLWELVRDAEFPVVEKKAPGIVRQIRIDADTLELIEERIPYHGRIAILSQIIRDWINE
jgi:hypothetical protein